MEKQQILDAIKEACSNSKKRKFKQSFDLIISLKGLDLKKPEHQIDLPVGIHHVGKKAKVCVFAGPELIDNAKKYADNSILADNFSKLSKKEIKKLANEYDFFVSQANIMPKVATSFGRILGPRGKMPNPKTGCIVQPNANLEPLIKRLQKTIRIVAKISPVVQCSVGLEDMKDEEIADTILTIYNAVYRSLPNEKQNIKDIYLKLTMGKPVIIGEKIDEKNVPNHKNKS